MRTVPAALAALTLTLGIAAPALAHPVGEIIPPLTVDLTHAATDNVAFHARYHEHFGSAGGILTSNDDYVDADGAPIEFYVVTDGRGVYTYDISNKLQPELMDMLVLRQEAGGAQRSSQEDPSTDGRTLLVGGDPSELGPNPLSTGRVLHVIDITDPTNITILGNHTADDHTWTCVTDIESGNGCGYAYGRTDNIIDLRDPANPSRVDGGWKGLMGEGGYVHDLTEIRPGLVMSAGAQPVLMDTTDPSAPLKLTHTTLFDHQSPNDNKFVPVRSWSQFGYHSVEWSRGGADDFLLMGTELGGAGSDCADDEDVIETWDARPVRDALATYDAMIADGASRVEARNEVFGSNGDKVDFIRLDTYLASERGIFLTGQAAASDNYCAHWMEMERDWNNGGRVAAGYYNRGVRFMEVDADGMFTEIGWFTGADARTGSVQWIDDEVLYVHDYYRGLDVISIAGADATGTYEGTGSVSDAAMTVAELESFGLLPAPAPDSPTSPALVVAAAGLLAAAGLTRRRRA